MNTFHLHSQVTYLVIYEVKIDKNVLKEEYDAARQILGGNWQLPTSEMWEKLMSVNYEWTWTNEGDCNGVKVENTSTGFSIFLPAAGRVDTGTRFWNDGSVCYYWSSSSISDTHAYYLYVDNRTKQINNNIRCDGFSVRPVRLVAVP